MRALWGVFRALYAVYTGVRYDILCGCLRVVEYVGIFYGLYGLVSYQWGVPYFGKLAVFYGGMSRHGAGSVTRQRTLLEKGDAV